MNGKRSSIKRRVSCSLFTLVHDNLDLPSSRLESACNYM